MDVSALRDCRPCWSSALQANRSHQGTNRHGVEQQISIESGEETTVSECGDLDEEPGSTVEVIEDAEVIAVGVEGDF